MSDQVKAKLLVLWQDEIRLAAKALAAFRAASEDESGVGVDERNRLAAAAFVACDVALYGADDEDSALLLTSKPTPRTKAGQLG